MPKYKIAVYAICKNEIKHAGRWMASMGEADGVYVLDTGSEDGSPEELSRLGAHVSKAVIDPWRFDRARNMSLDAVPEDYDICVCCDLDEVFPHGWREKLEQAWSGGINRLSYPFVYDAQNGESFFYRNLIHSRRGFKWVYPIHEALYCTGQELCGRCDTLKLYHYPDPSKSRDSYLPLLEKAVEEYPGDLRMRHYLGREYMFRGMYDKALPVLRSHAAECSWAEEKSASLRYAGRCLEALDRPEEAEEAYRSALRACPHMREPYVELALRLYKSGNMRGCLGAALGSLAITEPQPGYFNEGYAWGSLPWDLAAVSAFKLGQTERAVFYAKKALDLTPSDQRLLSNYNMMKDAAGISAL